MLLGSEAEQGRAQQRPARQIKGTARVLRDQCQSARFPFVHRRIAHIHDRDRYGARWRDNMRRPPIDSGERRA